VLLEVHSAVMIVTEKEVGMRTCDCEEKVRRERRRCQGDGDGCGGQTGMEEKMHAETVRKNELVMTKIVQKLVELGRNMKAEQARVEKLLHSKDLLIRQLQGIVGSQKEGTKQGSDSGYENRINDDISDDTENITSDSISDNSESMISDKTDMKSEIIPPEPMNQTYGSEMHNSSLNISGPTALTTVPNIGSIKGPKPPLASRESVNAKLHLTQPKVIDYVLVTKQRSDISPISGLYVLDTTSDVVENISGVATNDNNAVTPVHAMTNHRRVLKPSDIKYRDRRRAVSMSDKTRVTYWTDTYL